LQPEQLGQEQHALVQARAGSPGSQLWWSMPAFSRSDGARYLPITIGQDVAKHCWINEAWRANRCGCHTLPPLPGQVMKIVDVSQRSPAWRLWRSQGVGASEAAILMNRSPYKTPWRWWAEKTGLVLGTGLDQ